MKVLPDIILDFSKFSLAWHRGLMLPCFCGFLRNELSPCLIRPEVRDFSSSHSGLDGNGRSACRHFFDFSKFSLNGHRGRNPSIFWLCGSCGRKLARVQDLANSQSVIPPASPLGAVGQVFIFDPCLPSYWIFQS